MLPLILLPAVMLAQPALDGETARVFRFAHAETPQQRQEIANAVRQMTEIQRLALDGPAGAMAVRGTAAQLELTAWVVGELDRAAGAPQATVVESHKLAGDYAPQVRAFLLAHASNPQTLQEITNAVRAIADLQRVASVDANAAILVRGSSDQVELAAWVIRNLDRPAGVAAETKPLEYTYNDPSNRPQTAVRMFRLAHSTSPQALQEVANAVRSIADVHRLSVNPEVATLTLRATPDQASMAAWLVDELDGRAK
jgi:phage host-nuclease inhibitor protein Gam